MRVFELSQIASNVYFGYIHFQKHDISSLSLSIENMHFFAEISANLELKMSDFIGEKIVCILLFTFFFRQL